MHFEMGITMLSHLSGNDHKNICHVLLGLIIGLPLPGGQVSSHIVWAVRALLNFLYLSQLPSHTTDTLRWLQDSLALFHDNKAVFVDLGMQQHFNFPKLHSLLHYVLSIMLFGTTDNYNTEQTEHLHIDFAKDAYCATNHKDEYKQMTVWLEHCEKVQQHAASIRWHEQARAGTTIHQAIGPPQVHHSYLKMAKNPTINSVSFDDLDKMYSADHF